MKSRGDCLCAKAVHNEVVTLLSTVDCANNFVEVQRKVAVNQKWKKITVKMPYVVKTYDAYMNAVEKSDQMISKLQFSL